VAASRRVPIVHPTIWRVTTTLGSTQQVSR